MPHVAAVPRVNADLQAQLGDTALDRIARHLHPVDCQWCGRPLGDRTPALVVVQLSADVAEALLVHTRCSPPAWIVDGHNWSGPVETFGTWRAGAATVTVGSIAGEREWLPAVVVNPGLESVHLSRVDGVWRPDPAIAAWPLTPVTDLSDEPVGTRRIPSARVRVNGDRVSIGPAEEPDRWWVKVANEAFWAGLEARGGFLLVLTYSLDPHQMDAAALAAMRTPGEAVAGWIRTRR